MAETLVIGSRGSGLALTQTHWVRDRMLAAHPGLAVTVRVVQTQGDKILDVALSRIGDKGLFTKELEQALLRHEIDLAVHSLKDLPTRMAEGLALGAVSTREDCREAFISADGTPLAALPPGSVVGTSSLRRRSQLLWRLPHLATADIRGNVETRLRKVREGKTYAGALMAVAGLIRLGRADEATEVLDPDFILPAVGQGFLAVEVRDEMIARALVSPVHDEAARRCASAERAFLAELEGGCQVPVGALAEPASDELVLRGYVGDTEGKRVYRATRRFASGFDPEDAGRAVARELLAQGADAVLAEIFAQARER